MNRTSLTGKLLDSEVNSNLISLIFRDLKPDNIALTEAGEVRLIDFGHATRLNKEPFQILPGQSTPYMSPEVSMGLPAGLASDWWPYAVICAYLFLLKVPFNGVTDDELQRPNLDDMPPDLSVAKDLFSKLLVVNPELRLQKVTTHALFQRITKNPYKPGPLKTPASGVAKQPMYFAADPHLYELLEGCAIRIPPSEYFASEYYKSIL